MISDVGAAVCFICESESDVALRVIDKNGSVCKVEKADINQIMLCDSCAERIHKNRAESNK
ncbi:hypothetical protein [Pseudoalteromonas undina]|uniref:hypothetical protein n=1 Tax=Pseudoalteromonas undina TaxID=43660 RepID=UPI001866EABC|nr:hypothetical protein [Pseudoalteromonas undina]